MAWFQIDFYSTCLKRHVPVNVLLPYDPPEEKIMERDSLKTLYLLHGYGGNCMDYLLYGEAADISRDFGIAIVVPSGDNDFYLNRKRQDVQSETYIAQELVSFTRKMFPVLSKKREDTIIAGLSMGAYGSLRIGLKYPEVFGHVIVNSTSLSEFLKASARQAEESPDHKNRFGIVKGFYEQHWEGLEQMEKTDGNPIVLARKLSKEDKSRLDLYISVGYNDSLAGELREMIRVFREMDIPVKYAEYPGTHEWKVFNASLRGGLEYVLGCPQEEPNGFWVEGAPCMELIG